MKPHQKVLIFAVCFLALGAAVGPIVNRLRDLSDVRLPGSVTSGQALVWNGTVWTNGVSSGGTATNAPVISQNGTNGGLEVNFTNSATVTWTRSGSNWLANVEAVSPAGVTFVYDLTTVTNSYTINGKGNTLIMTNYIRMPWQALTMSGSNISSMDFAAASMFKVTLTNNGFLTAPTGLPGTNVAQVVQLFVRNAGGFTLTSTNGSYQFAGSGFTTNQVLSINTNANALTVLTLVTSESDATKVEGVVAAIGQ